MHFNQTAPSHWHYHLGPWFCFTYKNIVYSSNIIYQPSKGPWWQPIQGTLGFPIKAWKAELLLFYAPGGKMMAGAMYTIWQMAVQIYFLPWFDLFLYFWRLLHLMVYSSERGREGVNQNWVTTRVKGKKVCTLKNGCRVNNWDFPGNCRTGNHIGLMRQIDWYCREPVEINCFFWLYFSWCREFTRVIWGMRSFRG